jgi:hypothetical protein
MISDRYVQPESSDSGGIQGVTEELGLKIGEQGAGTGGKARIGTENGWKTVKCLNSC